MLMVVVDDVLVVLLLQFHSGVMLLCVVVAGRQDAAVHRVEDVAVVVVPVLVGDVGLLALLHGS